VLPPPAQSARESGAIEAACSVDACATNAVAIARATQSAITQYADALLPVAATAAAAAGVSAPMLHALARPLVAIASSVKDAPYIGPVVSVLLLLHQAVAAIKAHDKLVNEARVGCSFAEEKRRDTLCAW
jgi:hypothetical protein